MTSSLINVIWNTVRVIMPAFSMWKLYSTMYLRFLASIFQYFHLYDKLFLGFLTCYYLHHHHHPSNRLDFSFSFPLHPGLFPLTDSPHFVFYLQHYFYTLLLCLKILWIKILPWSFFVSLDILSIEIFFSFSFCFLLLSFLISFWVD